jgi:beta-mannosidase
MATVAEEDNSRVIRGACPFGLYTSGVHTLTGLPNGQPLRWTQNWHAQNCDDHALWCNKTDSEVPWQGGAEQHGPYNNGNGGMWRTINSNGGGGLFTDPALLVAVQPGFLVSAGQPGYFKSETGCTSLSSYESMAATLKPTEYGVNTEPFRERNYAANSLILSYFGAHRDMSVVGVEALQSQTYLSMLAASLERKSDIESWRSTGIWGMLMWQLNEIWPTGGWGSLEYGTPVPGQVIGGRWKIMHHALQQSAFADVVASCGKEMTSTGAGEYGIGGIAGSTANGSALCYIRNDLPTAFVGTVAVEAIHFNTGQTTTLSTVPVSVPAAGEYGSVSFFCAANSTKLSRGKPGVCASFDKLYGLAGCTGGPADCFLNVTVTAADDSTGSSPKQPCRNILLLALPSKLHLPRANVNLEQGRFSDNAFVLLPGVTKKVWFLPFNKAGTSAVALKASLRVEHLGMYL